jgi:hypothetical protein
MSSTQTSGKFLWDMQMAPLIQAFLLLTIFVGLVTPRYIRGVPHNKGTWQWLLGDTPSWISHTRKKGEIYTWLRTQTVRLNSPIVQVAVRPFARPWIVLADFRETQDILTRRAKTFDRAEFMQKVFRTIIPHGMITYRSEDPNLQVNKMLVRGFMGPTVLNKVNRANESSIFY